MEVGILFSTAAIRTATVRVFAYLGAKLSSVETFLENATLLLINMRENLLTSFSSSQMLSSLLKPGNTGNEYYWSLSSRS